MHCYYSSGIPSVVVLPKRQETLWKSSWKQELPGIPHTNRFSPGYCGWHVNEQKLLFSLLPDNVCGITLNSSALMYPINLSAE